MLCFFFAGIKQIDYIFFFSSRRRHTRSTRDWSSDVCSSDLEADDLMLLYSAGKPVTVVAILQLWEQGKLGLDDRVGDYIDGWGAGKARCTIRHVLTHTGGFPNADATLFDHDVPYG